MKKILLLLLLLPIITFAQKEVIIHITTDNYPSETKWTLYKDSYPNGDTLGYLSSDAACLGLVLYPAS